MHGKQLLRPPAGTIQLHQPTADAASLGAFLAPPALPCRATIGPRRLLAAEFDAKFVETTDLEADFRLGAATAPPSAGVAAAGAGGGDATAGAAAGAITDVPGAAAGAPD